MSAQTKAMLNSWLNSFMTALIASLIVVFGDGEISIEDIKYVIVSAVVAVLPVIKNYFDKNDPRYGRGSNVTK